MATKSFSLEDLAKLVDGEVVGKPSLKITGIQGLKEAKKGDLSLLYHPSYLKDLVATQASAILTHPEFKSQISHGILTANPRLSLCTILELFKPAESYVHRPDLSFIDPLAKVDPTAIIYPFVTICKNAVVEKNVILYSGVFIGENSCIGEGSKLYPYAVVYPDCILGKRVTLNSHVSIGVDGFGYVLEQGKAIKIPHIKRVVVGDDVEVGASSAIDRGSMVDTIIGDRTKIDNQVQVAHNVQLGEDNMLFSQSAFAGSTKTGKEVLILGKSGVGDNLYLPDKTVLGPSSMMARSPKKAGVYYGYPAREKEDWIETMANANQLKKFIQKLKVVEEELAVLKKTSAKTSPEKP